MSTSPGAPPAPQTPASNPRLPRTKGTLLMEAVRVAREQGEALAARLSPRTRELLQGSVLAGSWYPEEALRELLEASDAAGLHRLGQAQARKDLVSVYRSLFKADDLCGTLSSFPMVWSLYHDSGAALFERRTAGHVRLTVRGFAMPSAALCAFTAGWIEGAAELACGRPVDVEATACRVQGADRCVFEARLRA